MSWTASFASPLKPDEITVENATFGFGPYEDAPPEVKDQIDVAFAKARSIAFSGAIGDTAKAFNVLLSGHANPGHEPVAGWSNDMITVSVSQAG